MSKILCDITLKWEDEEHKSKQHGEYSPSRIRAEILAVIPKMAQVIQKQVVSEVSLNEIVGQALTILEKPAPLQIRIACFKFVREVLFFFLISLISLIPLL